MRKCIGALLVLLLLLLLLLIAPAGAATYFNSVPNPLIQGNPGDTCATNPAACAKASDMNANFNQLIVDGNAAKAAIQSQLTGVTTAGMPSGALIMVNNTVCPFGWVAADGVGGSPDARGIFIRGLDKGAGRDPGRVLASYQADAIQQHDHGAIGVVANPVLGTSLAGGSDGAANGVNGGSVTTEEQVGGLSETRPRNVVLLHCYKK
jgi:hypothetical protein